MKTFRLALRIVLKSFSINLLKSAVENIVGLVKATGSSCRGPVALPSKLKRFVVLRSPHVDKKARDQFEICSHKRLVDVLLINLKTLEALMRTELPAEVGVHIKLQNV